MLFIVGAIAGWRLAALLGAGRLLEALARLWAKRRRERDRGPAVGTGTPERG